VDERLKDLTDAQRDAVLHVEGPLLVLAGPGSGKTRVVTHRISHLVDVGVSPRNILALTFTNKAADEMRIRAEQLVGRSGLQVSTFHRFCARLLRGYAPQLGLESNYSIHDAADTDRAIKRVVKRLRVPTDICSLERIHKGISWAKNNLIEPDNFAATSKIAVADIVEKVYKAYQSYMRESNAVDFDDLLMHVALLLRDNPEIRADLDARYKFILVDEYQDTNLAQYAIVRALSVDYPNLSVTGDPDQAIYGWRGANLNNILDFETDYPDVKVVRLERNYRSTQRILSVASTLIAHNIRRKKKSLYSENEQGPPVRLVTYPTQLDEAMGIGERITELHRAGRPYRDFAVFFRVGALSRTLEVAMRHYGIPYQLVSGVEFYKRKEIKDILAYLQAIANPRNEEAMRRIINTPTRGIGGKSVERLADHAIGRGMSMRETLEHVDEIPAIKGKSAKSVVQFAETMRKLDGLADQPVEEILGHILTLTKFREQFDEELEEDQQRLANIEELLTAARQSDERAAEVEEVARESGTATGPWISPLESFLEEASLVNETDDWETEVDRVTLMTLHASKGLEFPVVFIMAVEEGLLPHERSKDDEKQLEEERRLLFVGITRAQEDLQLSIASYRDFRGRRRMAVPSTFLNELPREDLEMLYLGSTGSFGTSTLEGFGSRRQGMSGDASLTGGDFDAHYETTDYDHVDTDADEEVFEHTYDDDPDASFDPAMFDTPPPDDVADEEPIDEPTVEPEPELAAKPKKKSRSPKKNGLAGLTTAAELGGDEAKPKKKFKPDDYHQGMIVRHPDFGLGRIVAISGSGKRRTATVNFIEYPGERRYVLFASPLEPAGGVE